MARPPENIFVKDILEIVGGSAPHEKGAISDVLLRRDQAAQKALEGITLKSLVEENPATVLQIFLLRIGYSDEPSKSVETTQ